MTPKPRMLSLSLSRSLSLSLSLSPGSSKTHMKERHQLRRQVNPLFGTCLWHTKHLCEWYVERGRMRDLRPQEILSRKGFWWPIFSRLSSDQALSEG